jgi:hypothetical protein
MPDKPAGPTPDETHLTGRWARKSWAVWFGDADAGRLVATFRTYRGARRYWIRMDRRYPGGWFCVVPTGCPPTWIEW